MNTIKVKNIAELKLRKGTPESTVEVLGYYTEGDGGGGNFYWDNTSTETDNGGTIISVSTVGIGRWKRNVTNNINVKWFGAKGDGITNDFDKVNNILTYCNSKTVSSVIEFFDGVYKINSPLNIRIDKVSINGNSCELDFSSITNGDCIVITGSSSGQPYNNVTQYIKGLKIKGSGKANTSYGIFLGNHPEAGTSHTLLSDLSIYNFNTGLRFGDNAYIITMLHSNIYECGKCIDNISLVNNSERMTFVSCTFFNSDMIANLINPNSDYYFTNCSFDYSNIFIETVDARVFCNGCHFEGSNFTANYVFKISGNGGLVSIKDSVIITQPSTYPDYIFDIQTTEFEGGGVILDNVNLINVNTISKFLSTGNGKIKIYNSDSYDLFGINILLNENNNSNLLLDGKFEESSILDDFLVKGIDTITDQTDKFTSLNSIIELSTTEYISGTKSLKWTKPYGSGSESTVKLYVPIPKDQTIGFSINLKKPGTSTGTLFISYYCVGGYNLEPLKNFPLHTKSILKGTSNITLTSSVLNWTNYNGYMRTPAWATHFLIEINGISWNSVGESIYFDDIIINSF